MGIIKENQCQGGFEERNNWIIGSGVRIIILYCTAYNRFQVVISGHMATIANYHVVHVNTDKHAIISPEFAQMDAKMDG